MTWARSLIETSLPINPRVVPWLGIVDDSGAVVGARTGRSHSGYGMPSAKPEQVWRYRPEIRTAFWWGPAPEFAKAALEVWLGKKGLGVRQHLDILADPTQDTEMASHGRIPESRYEFTPSGYKRSFLGWWLDPQGELHSLQGVTHQETACQILGREYDPHPDRCFNAEQDLYAKGWRRVVREPNGTDLYCNGGPINRAQEYTLMKKAISGGYSLMANRRWIYEPPDEAVAESLPDPSVERVKSPAMRVGQDTIIEGPDHADCQIKAEETGLIPPVPGSDDPSDPDFWSAREKHFNEFDIEMGFTTTSGRFVSRGEAYQIARKAGQVKKPFSRLGIQAKRHGGLTSHIRLENPGGLGEAKPKRLPTQTEVGLAMKLAALKAGNNDRLLAQAEETVPGRMNNRVKKLMGKILGGEASTPDGIQQNVDKSRKARQQVLSTWQSPDKSSSGSPRETSPLAQLPRA